LEQSDPDPVSSSLHETSDKYMMNCVSFGSEFCSLDDAGFAFTACHVTPVMSHSTRLATAFIELQTFATSTSSNNESPKSPPSPPLHLSLFHLLLPTTTFF
jgi:hypothetical protein